MCLSRQLLYLAGYFLRNKALQGSTQQIFNLALIVGLNFLLGSSQGSMIDNRYSSMQLCKTCTACSMSSKHDIYSTEVSSQMPLALC